jgi:hypothetical protein
VKPEELEAKIHDLTKDIEQLETKLQAQEDIEAIKKLQRAYGYYLEHWQEEQILGLFSHSPEVSVEIHDTGLYKGWEAVKKSFQFGDHYTAFNGEKTAPPEFLHILMPINGIVDLNPDRTARQRKGDGMVMAL